MAILPKSNIVKSAAKLRLFCKKPAQHQSVVAASPASSHALANQSDEVTTSSLYPPAALDDVLIKPMVEAALIEDLGRRGDITSQATIPAQQQAKLILNVRQTGVVCGMDLAILAFKLINPDIVFSAQAHDGQLVQAGTTLATIEGNARDLLAAERTALNYLTHLSGIATATYEVTKQIHALPTQITCSRKTIPGLRILQKYAVRCGGGTNHRMGLDDAILIKDNHIAIAGNISKAISQAKAMAGHLIPIEIEVDTLTQLEEALSAGATFVLLDNMDNSTLTKAVKMCQDYADKHGVLIRTEASGGVTPEKVTDIANTGVDFIAMGYLTHSTAALDIGMDFVA